LDEWGWVRSFVSRRDIIKVFEDADKSTTEPGNPEDVYSQSDIVSMKEENIGIGVIGLGTVGSGVMHIYRENRERLLAGSSVPLRLEAVCDLDFTRSSADLSGLRQTGNWRSMVDDPRIGIVVELIGGEEPARSIIEASLQAGKHVVTANKLVLAKHGMALWNLAAANGVSLLFEAAVGGAIPLIAPLGSTLLPNRVQGIYGILNGTTNYILTRMIDQGADYQTVLKEAQEYGYAEADPTSDVEGFDSLYKLCVLCAMTFQANIPLQEVLREGITGIDGEDIRFLKERGQTVRLIAIARPIGARLELRVHPVVLDKNHPLAAVKDVFNAVYLQGDCVGESMFYGRGAGGVPTASSVWADILSLANRTAYRPPPLHTAELLPAEEILSRYYMRLAVADSKTAIAEVGRIFAAHHIGLREAVLTDQASGKELILLTDQAMEKDKNRAVEALPSVPGIEHVSTVLRVGF